METDATKYEWRQLLSPGTATWKLCAIQPSGLRGPFCADWGFSVVSPTKTPTPTPTPTDPRYVDFSRDSKVDHQDLFYFTSIWKNAVNDADFNPEADLVQDDVIDRKDLLVFYENYHRTYNVVFPPSLVWPGRNVIVDFADLYNNPLQWQAIPEVETYQVHIEDASGYYPRDKFVTENSLEFFTTFLSEYHWKVRAFEPKHGAWSENRRFLLVREAP